MSFIDVADVKARRSIEQATKSLGLKCTEEKNQLKYIAPLEHDRRWSTPSRRRSGIAVP
jgi:hypothetical protein